MNSQTHHSDPPYSRYDETGTETHDSQIDLSDEFPLVEVIEIAKSYAQASIADFAVGP
jgi:hypothetical protein